MIQAVAEVLVQVEDNIVNIEEKLPHIVINCGERVHVLPRSLIVDVIEERKCITQIEGWNDIVKVILTGFLEMIEEA